MKPSNTKERLKYLMATRNLKQVDILKLAKPYSEKYGVKFNKSDISQYVTGRAEPNQDKLFVLGQALGVSEAWLMGFDVPMDRTPIPEQTKKSLDATISKANAKKVEINQLLDQLNDAGHDAAIAQLKMLTKIDEFKK